MREVLSLAMKDLRLLLRDKAGFFFTFFFPLIYCVFFGMVFGGMGGKGTSAIKVIVVDEDDSAGSRTFVDRLDARDELGVVRKPYDEAADAVRRGQAVAFIRMSDGFGKGLDNMFAGETAVVELGLDPSRKAEAGMLKGILTATAFEGMQDMFTNPEIMKERTGRWLKQLRQSEDMNPLTRMALEAFLPALADFTAQMAASSGKGDGPGGGMRLDPVRIETSAIARSRSKGPANAYEITFPQGIIWGVIGCAAGFGISMVSERSNGTLVRLRMAPISQWHILGGKACACFMTIIVLMGTLFTLGALVFGVEPDSLLALAAATLSTAIGFVGIMMLLSVMGKTEQSAGGIGWAVLMVMAMVGGGMLPLAFMPAWLQKISHISPVKWSILAMEGAIWRDFSSVEMLLPCGILFLFGVVCFVIGTRAFQWSSES